VSTVIEKKISERNITKKTKLLFFILSPYTMLSRFQVLITILFSCNRVDISCPFDIIRI
jgi:hypothetical protein